MLFKHKETGVVKDLDPAIGWVFPDWEPVTDGEQETSECPTCGVFDQPEEPAAPAPVHRVGKHSLISEEGQE